MFLYKASCRFQIIEAFMNAALNCQVLNLQQMKKKTSIYGFALKSKVPKDPFFLDRYWKIKIS